MVDASVVYEKRLADTAGQLLLSDLNQLLRDVSTKRTSIACRYVAVVAISRNLYTQLLCCFKFHLLQRLISLWDNELVTSVSAAHRDISFRPLHVVCVASLQGYYVHHFENYAKPQKNILAFYYER